MVSSLSTKFYTTVRLIALGSSSAETLYPVVNSTICDSESCGISVEAVCIENYLMNVRLYKLFSADPKLEPKVQHPCNPQRSLILFLNIVHIIKSIGNNWLNLKDYESTFIIPKFDDCQFIAGKVVSNKSLNVSISTANISIDHFTYSSTNPVLCMRPFETSVTCSNPIRLMS